MSQGQVLETCREEGKQVATITAQVVFKDQNKLVPNGEKTSSNFVSLQF